jgi:tetratricopeptide (TPR) repeat protein
MKKSIFVFAIIMLPGLLLAQYEPKGKTTKAQVFLDRGELDKAKAEIDMAFEVNKKGKITSAGKNWYLRGQVYKAIYLDSGEYKSLEDNALEEAVESFNKAIELEKESSTYHLFSNQEMQMLYSIVMNQGAEMYNDDNYEKAYEAFAEALNVMPGDTTALLYAGVAAQQSGNMDEALEMYERLIETGNANIDTYKTVIYLYRQHKEDMDKVLEYTSKALEKFPDNKDIKQEMITALILLERVDEAKAELNKAIAEDPDNPVLYYELGYLYDYQEKYDEALEEYKRALEVDPNHYESNYNIGVIYVGKGNKVIQELNELSLDEYRKKEGEFLERANEHFGNAIPYLEKAAELKPTEDVALLETLEGVYIRLDMDDKAKALADRVKAITGQ